MTNLVATTRPPDGPVKHRTEMKPISAMSWRVAESRLASIRR